MSRDAFSVPFADDVTLLGILAVIVSVLLIRLGLREVCNRAALTVGGYLRRRPDPATENRLRAVFAELDAGLAEILGDRIVPEGACPPGCRPGCEGSGLLLRLTGPVPTGPVSAGTA